VPHGARKAASHEAALLTAGQPLTIPPAEAQAARLLAAQGKQETLPAGCEAGASAGIYQKFSKKIFLNQWLDKMHAEICCSAVSNLVGVCDKLRHNHGTLNAGGARERTAQHDHNGGGVCVPWRDRNRDHLARRS
jgi:hypothetical protein